MGDYLLQPQPSPQSNEYQQYLDELRMLTDLRTRGEERLHDTTVVRTRSQNDQLVKEQARIVREQMRSKRNVQRYTRKGPAPITGHIRHVFPNRANMTTESTVGMYFFHRYILGHALTNELLPGRLPNPNPIPEIHLAIARASRNVLVYLGDDSLPRVSRATLFAGAIVSALCETVGRDPFSGIDTETEEVEEIISRIRTLVRTCPKEQLDLYTHVDADAVRRIDDCLTGSPGSTAPGTVSLKRLADAFAPYRNVIPPKGPGRPRRVPIDLGGVVSYRWPRAPFPGAEVQSRLFAPEPVAPVGRVGAPRNTTRRARCPNGFFRDPKTAFCTHRSSGKTLPGFTRYPIPESAVESPKKNGNEASGSPAESSMGTTELESFRDPSIRRPRCPNGSRRIPAKTGKCVKTGGEGRVHGGGDRVRYLFSRTELQAVTTSGIWACMLSLHQVGAKDLLPPMAHLQHPTESLVLGFMGGVPAVYSLPSAEVEAICAAVWGGIATGARAATATVALVLCLGGAIEASVSYE